MRKPAKNYTHLAPEDPAATFFQQINYDAWQRRIGLACSLLQRIAWINCYDPSFNEAPWGGYKMSGQGRKLGVHDLEDTARLCCGFFSVRSLAFSSF